MARKQFVGLVLTGQKKGRVIKSHRNMFISLESYPAPETDPSGLQFTFDRTLFHHNRIAVGEEVFGIWVADGYHLLMEEVLLLLIHADSADVTVVQE